MDGGIIVIDPQGDLIIEVTEYDLHSSDSNGVRVIGSTVSLKVASKLLLHITSTKEFQATVRNDIVRFDQDTLTGVTICMYILHYENPPEYCYSITIEELRNVFGFAKKSGFDLTKFRDWFGVYYSNLSEVNVDAWRAFLFPTWICDLPGEFAEVSRTLAFTGYGHISEMKNERYPELRVPSRIIDQINRAKGNMKGKIMQDLLDITAPRSFCPQNCGARAKSIEAYLEALEDSTDLYPMSRLHKLSIEKILDGRGFKNWICKVPEGACKVCKSHLSKQCVIKAAIDVLEYWQGLCLDCMDLSKSKTGRLHRGYWEHGSLSDWDRGCRIEHGRNTWFHSFMGRDEEMTKYQEMHKEGMRGGYGPGGSHRLRDSSYE